MPRTQHIGGSELCMWTPYNSEHISVGPCALLSVYSVVPFAPLALGVVCSETTVTVTVIKGLKLCAVHTLCCALVNQVVSVPHIQYRG